MTEAETRTFGRSEAVASDAVRIRLLSATIACFLFASGCASDGQVLRDPSPDQTTTTRPPPVTTPPDLLEAESGLKISSPDFEPGDTAPKDLTCDGKNVFPTLEWEGSLPANGKELAITLTDQSNPEEPLLLWLVAGISTSVTQVNTDLVPDNAVETLNDYGQSGFGDPCIETDSESKDLQFRLHVLSAESGIKADAPGNEAYDQVKSLSIDSTAILVKIESGVALAAGTD